MLLRLFGAQIAPDALPYPSAKIYAPWNLVMESNSCIADGVDCYNVATISICSNATVSQRAYLCTPSHDFRSPNFDLIAAEITIGENAWVATEAFIGPGVTVDHDAVVGARAVVYKNVPPGVVVAGNPARIVSSRS
jgi:putative colanic acid biosynthesis acetyltransferase WcaF